MMTKKQEAVKDKYAQFQLSKDTKEVEKFPILDEKKSRKMQAEFINNQTIKGR